MLHGGLVSITFRQLAAEEIIDLVVEAGLSAVEWGGDIHAPHGDTRTANDLAERTRGAGLHMPMYGSYYRLGESERDELPFARVLESAVELGTPRIRVWAGHRSSADADETYRNAVVDDAIRCAEMAAGAGISIAYEYHANTLTDTMESAVRLLKETQHPSIETLWQPPNDQHEEHAGAGLQTIIDRVVHLHVFAWERENRDIIRQPLAEHAERWSRYLGRFKNRSDKVYAMLEFVAGDDPDRFLTDAATLQELLRVANSEA